MFGKILKIPFAIVADIATLGGAINDKYFENGNKTYTGKIFSDMNKEIQLKEDLKTLETVSKAIKRIIE